MRAIIYLLCNASHLINFINAMGQDVSLVREVPNTPVVFNHTLTGLGSYSSNERQYFCTCIKMFFVTRRMLQCEWMHQMYVSIKQHHVFLGVKIGSYVYSIFHRRTVVFGRESGVSSNHVHSVHSIFLGESGL